MSSERETIVAPSRLVGSITGFVAVVASLTAIGILTLLETTLAASQYDLLWILPATLAVLAALSAASSVFILIDRQNKLQLLRRELYTTQEASYEDVALLGDLDTMEWLKNERNALVASGDNDLANEFSAEIRRHIAGAIARREGGSSGGDAS